MRASGSEEFDAVTLIDSLNKERVQYLLSSRQAVVLCRAPLLSFDYDLWVRPDDRDKVYDCLHAFGLQSKRRPSELGYVRPKNIEYLEGIKSAAPS